MAMAACRTPGTYLTMKTTAKLIRPSTREIPLVMRVFLWSEMLISFPIMLAMVRMSVHATAARLKYKV